jgi:enoyl-CoA hydratase
VLLVRINRPDQRNAMNGPVMAGIGRAILDAESDPEIRAVVLTGTGDKAFCAGMDLKAFASGNMGGPDDPEAMAAFGAFTSGGATGGDSACSKPVIAAAQATALAGGLELVLACDLAVVSEDAKLGIPEVKRGLFAAGGGMYLARRIPLAKALEMAMTGEPITPAEALQLGLINAVVPAAEVVDKALALAAKIAENGPLGVQASKKLVRAAAFQPLADVKPQHDAAVGTVFASKDAKEGSRAFAERRAPQWTGQ